VELTTETAAGRFVKGGQNLIGGGPVLFETTFFYGSQGTSNPIGA
jgi:hypothetical protein